MGYEIKQREFDGRWCIYSSKFNIVIAEFVDGIPQVTIDEIRRHLTSRSSRAADACVECGTTIGNHPPYCPKYEP